MKRATKQKIEADQVEINNHFVNQTRPMLKKITQEGWKPESIHDVIDILMEVQIGYISCGKAATILFPELK